MQRRTFHLLVASNLLASPLLFARRAHAAESKGPTLGETQTSRVQIGMVVQAGPGPCTGLVGTAPVPIEWPEQQVKIVDEEYTPGVRADYRQITSTVRQMVVSIPFLPAGMEAKALVTFEVKRALIEAPKDPSIFKVPERITPDLRPYLAASPGIETRHIKLRAGAKEAVEGKSTAWEKVEAIYDWAREKVEYENGPFQGAVAALTAGKGDCEELSSLFIALCRINSIPARTVWVPEHCYPEFYLVDDDGKGHWIPCQAAGTRCFGSMPEFRPILQKGDNFLVPEHRGPQRYVAEFLTGKGGKPSCQFVREMVDAG